VRRTLFDSITTLSLSRTLTFAIGESRKKDTIVDFHGDEFPSKIGKTFPILSERLMRPGVLIAADFKTFKYVYDEDDSLEREEIPTLGHISTLAYLIPNLSSGGLESHSQCPRDLRLTEKECLARSPHFRMAKPPLSKIRWCPRNPKVETELLC